MEKDFKWGMRLALSRSRAKTKQNKNTGVTSLNMARIPGCLGKDVSKAIKIIVGRDGTFALMPNVENYPHIHRVGTLDQLPLTRCEHHIYFSLKQLKVQRSEVAYGPSKFYQQTFKFYPSQ